MLTQGFDIEQTGTTAVIRFTVAQLDANLMQETVVELMQRLRCDNAGYFIFDLTGVNFLCSACLGALVQFLQEVEHVRGRIALANCQPSVAHSFQITRLDSVFHIYDDLPQARAAILKG